MSLPSVLSVSAAHQFAVNRWNPQYSGLATTGATHGQQSSSGMSSSTPPGISIVCILRTQQKNNQKQGIFGQISNFSKNLIRISVKTNPQIEFLQNILYF